ncbi:MAG: glycoside hydrolase family 88 protein [Dehalococcoidia bacterium]
MSSDVKGVVSEVVARALADREAGGRAPHWGDAILIDALHRAGEEAGAGTATGVARTWFDEKIAAADLNGPSWNWGHLPMVAWDLFATTGDKRYREYALAVAEHIASGTPKTAEGLMATHGGQPQLWVDSMFFSLPALYRAARETGEIRWREEASRDLEGHVRHLYNPGSGLFYHCWDEGYDGPARFTGSGFAPLAEPAYWARGNAWALLALVDAVANGEDQYRPLLQKLSMRLLALQDKRSGLWPTVVDDSSSYLETSASAMFALAFLRGWQLHLLEDEFKQAAARALDGLLTRVDRGRVGGVSAQTPPGSAEDYNAIPIGEETYGTGFVILLGLEPV